MSLLALANSFGEGGRGPETLSLRAPCALAEPVRPPGGPLKILLPLEPGPFSRQGGLLGASKIVLPLEPGPLLRFQASQEVPRDPQDADRRLLRDPRSSPRALRGRQETPRGCQKEPKRPPRDPRSSPRAPRGRQEAAKMPYDAPKRLPRGFQEPPRATQEHQEQRKKLL